jgi:hypothetical protein
MMDSTLVPVGIVTPGRKEGGVASRPNNFPAKLPTYCHQKRNLAIEKRNLHFFILR